MTTKVTVTKVTVTTYARDGSQVLVMLGMKDCEMAEKLEWLKAIAAHLGVDVKDLAP
jgi:hypothetical protein